MTMGKFREYNTPVPLLLTDKLYAYCSGNRKETLRVLRKNVKSLGKKRAYGYGKITNIYSERIDEDWSISANGIAMRWIPDKAGTKLVRCQPPYWHPYQKTMCVDVGDSICEL